MAATIGFISDDQRRMVTDPGMVPHRSVILLGRRLLAIRRPDVLLLRPSEVEWP